MAPDDKTPPGDGGDGGEGGGEGDKPLHPAERRKIETARKAAEKERDDLKAKLAEIDNAGKSELDKLRAELEQMKPSAARLKKYEEQIQADADELLEGLPKEAKKQLQPVLEDLADPMARIRVVRAFIANSKSTEPPPNPSVNRQPPARKVEGLPRSMAEFSAAPLEQQVAWAELAQKEKFDLNKLP